MDEYVAVVEKIVGKGKHGPYAVASSQQLGEMVTFSLDQAVWEEASRPERGEFVILSDLRRKRAGWRAMKARFVRPSDKAQQLSTEHKEK